MNYYVFNTEGEANTAQASDFLDFKAESPELPAEYWDITIRWGIPKQRATDNKWVYQVCPASTAVGRTIEALDYGGEWFPEST